MLTTAPPRPVVVAGVVCALEGVALFVSGIVLLVVQGAPTVWGFVILLGAGVAATGVALARGLTGARGPVVVAQLIGLGVAFYAGVSSARPDIGVPVAVVCAGVLAAILSRAARDWAEQ